MVLLVALPVGVALLIRLGGGQPNVQTILDTLLIRAVMPLLALVLGTAALGSELEDGTAVYLMVKPVPRWRILLAKMVVAAGITVAAGVPRHGRDGAPDGGRGPCPCPETLGYALVVSAGRRGVRVRVRHPQRVHRAGAHPGAVLRAHLGGRSSRASSKAPGSCPSARRPWGWRPGDRLDRHAATPRSGHRGTHPPRRRGGRHPPGHLAALSLRDPRQRLTIVSLVLGD